MDEYHDMPGYLIRRMHQISVSVFAERMTREGIDLTPVQFAALSAIAARPGLDQATLAGAIAYDRATLGGVVDRLEQKGMILRAVSASDRRARDLTITETGAALLNAARPIVATLQGDIVKGLTPAERGVLNALLKKATMMDGE